MLKWYELIIINAADSIISIKTCNLSMPMRIIRVKWSTNFLSNCLHYQHSI